MELISREIDPSRCNPSDKGFDCMRFLINTLFFYGQEFSNKQMNEHSELFNVVAEDLLHKINTNRCGAKFSNQGRYHAQKDQLFLPFANHPFIQSLPIHSLEW
jgi:hypothetical protein